MNTNTVIAATIMAGQIRDARNEEKHRIIALLLVHGQNEAARIIMEEKK